MPSAQIPVLCRSCGGPVEPRADLSLLCPFCGAEDRLPADELARALDLKRRVARARASAAQLRGLEGALSDMFERPSTILRVMAPYLILTGIVFVYWMTSSWGAIRSTPTALVPSMILYGLMGPMLVGGVAISAGIAMLVGRALYRRRVRPLLLARPPRQAGRPTRCRACGADLPDERGPFITCEFCSTKNLVTPEIQRDRAQLLDSEERLHRSRAAGAVTAVAGGSTHMTRTFTLCIVLSYAAMIGLAALAGALIR